MDKQQRDFLEKYSLDEETFNELISGPNSAEKINAYLKGFTDDVFAQLQADLDDIRRLSAQAEQQKLDRRRLKHDMIRQRQEKSKQQPTVKQDSKQKEDSVLDQQDSYKPVDHISDQHVDNKQEKVMASAPVPETKKVYHIKSKVPEKKHVVSQPVIPQQKHRATTLRSLVKKVFNFIKHVLPKIKFVSDNVQSKQVDLDAFKKREDAVKDIHDSNQKGTTY
jgi:hypothetical protein